MILDDAKLEYYLERKFYPRERSKEPTFIGRFRVHLKNEDGKPLREELPTRDALMLYIAEKLPQLKTRTNPKGTGAAEAAPNPANTGAVPKKKKGKK
jgi:signal recognition particle subunit SRP19